MRKINLGQSGLMASEIALGVMRINKHDVAGATNLIDAAYDAGVNFFDNADIYGGGKCETLFGQALKNASFSRDQVLVQTKVSIRPGMYDSSKKHIIEAVDASLQRLQLDYVDSLLLHRPDALMDIDEVADAFDTLHNAGKVRQFGVSNYNSMQVELLQSAVSQKLIANQLQFGVMHTGMIDVGIHANMTDARSINHDGNLLPYSQLKHMTVQAWSPYQSTEGVFIDNPKFPKLNAELHALADKYSTNVNAIAAAWILRVPGSMQVIAGTTNAKRIAEIAEADKAPLTRQEWYDVYLAAGNNLP